MKIRKVIEIVENENNCLIEQRDYPQEEMQKLLDIVE